MAHGALGIGAVAASAPPAVPGCSSGWAQLLPHSQRQQALRVRGCAGGGGNAEPSAPLAGQMAVYDAPVTHGPLGPLATATDASRASSAPPPLSLSTPARLVPTRSAGLVMRAAAPSARPVVLAPLIDRAARAHDIDPLLLHAIARVESRHNIRAVSHAGAHGLMQVIVPTAQRFGVGAAQALHDPGTNLDVSARYLKTLQRRFGNDLSLVLAAYNAGEGAVEKHGRRIPPYRETQDYVRKVMAEYGLLRRVSQRQPTYADGESML